MFRFVHRPGGIKRCRGRAPGGTQARSPRSLQSVGVLSLIMQAPEARPRPTIRKPRGQERRQFPGRDQLQPKDIEGLKKEIKSNTLNKLKSFLVDTPSRFFTNRRSWASRNFISPPTSSRRDDVRGRGYQGSRLHQGGRRIDVEVFPDPDRQKMTRHHFYHKGWSLYP